MLGESLYPLVDQLEHDMAAKVIGMLLKMDLTEHARGFITDICHSSCWCSIDYCS
uniref:PABC domain-containing protein n=1 Tax=Nelumbo nucifera TaxID=4432 RepID=A0A822ZNS4_NELNU|nr:TPA_asm: hypothetical protein HUJ06_001668 [Nelumbo nucifera]